MASSVIHLCVANEVNKVFHRKSKDILIGSIAPDISKHLGKTKNESHFLNGRDDIPNIELFIKKYGNRFDDDFVIGYYIHLYTDYLWFKYFVPAFIRNGYIYKLDGTKLPVSDKEKLNYFYNDYTNLNIKLIDEYNLDLSLFYEQLPIFEKIIQEIPMSKIDVIVNQAGIIIENSKEIKAYVFDMSEINKFINFSVRIIIKNLEQILNAK